MQFSAFADHLNQRRYSRNIHDPELLIPRRVFEDGSFHTFSLPKFYDRRDTETRQRRSANENEPSEKLHLVLPFNGADHHVELQPHREFISPDMVVEIRGAGISTNLNDALRFKRIPDEQCHYRGFVKGHRNSRAALSLCDGVAGYVQTNQGRYFIEPLEETEPATDGQHVHMVYRRAAPHEKQSDIKKMSKRHCGTDDQWESAWAEQLAKRQLRLAKNNSVTSKREDPKLPVASSTHSIHRFIEIGIIADRKFLDYHNGSNYEQYLLTIMNMASDYYHDSSTGNQIDVIVVRMIYLEKQKDEIDLHISPNAEKTLDSFAKWAEKMNPKDHEHPNHYDIAVLVTRHDICAETTSCDLLGLAFVAAACDPPKAACINEDSGLLLGIVITHEVGHVMGCSHDEEDISGCKEMDKDESYFVMSPIVFIYTIRWSPCSKKFITTLLDSGLGECLNNDPKNPPERYKLPNMLPGAMYDAEFQCNLDYPGSSFCDAGSVDRCEALWCKTSETKCSSKGAPAAEGTKCGENKWCIRKKCVEMGSRPKAVHGGWGDWGKMGECSRTCGGGIKSAERECDKPPPANGGRYCIGYRKKVTTCNTTPCDPSKPPFRATQCAGYDTKKVLTDGLHQWKPYMPEDENPCVLYCMNEKNTFVKLSPTAEDGTPCKGGTYHMCVSGVCRKVGCDWVLDSDTIEDQCGVCKGDGSQCTPVEGEFTKTGTRGYVKIVTIPKGSRSIHIAEKKGNENTLALKYEKDDKYCLNGKNIEQRDGEYECAGALAVYTHPEPQKEEILIKDPITEDVQVQYTFYDPNSNPGITYKYYVKSANSSYTPKYLWDYVEWSDCDAKCGGGTKLSEPTCIEQQAGKVSSSYCQSITRPEAKSEICNQKPCGPKWRVSQWSKCSACGGKTGTKHRKVQCVKPAAHPGGDDVQANLDACKGRVPKQSEECVGQRPCKRICAKKTRNSENFINVSVKPEARMLSLDEQRRMIDNFVDLGLARYLEKTDNSKSEKRNVAEDFRHLIHEWIVSGEENKRKRTCDREAGTDVENTREKRYTTPKPGSIIKDHAPTNQITLLQAPLRADYLKSNLSDLAFQESGDSVPMGLDTRQEKVYKGAQAVKILKDLTHTDSVSTSANDNNTERDYGTSHASPNKIDDDATLTPTPTSKSESD
ncbi:A disintegrin and metalloproteinase with thrombospondin motifs 7 [Cephus cinctus]|uniref:A disintegrin and metalloproteinase with thrombospondin motifs 7 n=1 Tax=Cephus cinctus TaxID=211228 RepID=A0AAJ7W749_CEPCN|nr:A disintegrin and metalloproteinase with thrombospondin motifs 7 [Cephus cinctus]